VWDPHVQPKFDKWIEEMKMKVKVARKRGKVGVKSTAGFERVDDRRAETEEDVSKTTAVEMQLVRKREPRIDEVCLYISLFSLCMRNAELATSLMSSSTCPH
jgi:hypothetical protein